MKKLTLCITCIVAFAALMRAQNIVGTWQGSLKVGPQELRTVVKISIDDDKPKAVFYSIDQQSPGFPSATFTKNGTAIKFTLPSINGSYEGTLSADGNSITGNWTQGAPIPLNLTRATAATEWAIPEPPPPLKSMAADAAPSFEVSTIKPSKPDARFSILVNRSGMFTTTNTSLSDLIKFAYDLHPRQISGGPGWVESEKFDITGKPDVSGMPNGKQLKMLVQKLLEERFQLSFHREKKELPVYAISVTKTGAKIAKSETDLNGLPGFAGGGPRGLLVRNATIEEFAHMLQANVLEKPVVDQTGFGPARYDFTIKWTPDAARAQAAAAAASTGTSVADNPDAPPDLFTAFQQQLGLKLESAMAPVDVIVIDRVEKPSAN